MDNWMKKNNVKVLKLHVPASLHNRFKDACKNNNKKISDVLLVSVKDYLKSNDKNR